MCIQKTFIMNNFVTKTTIGKTTLRNKVYSVFIVQERNVIFASKAPFPFAFFNETSIKLGTKQIKMYKSKTPSLHNLSGTFLLPIF